MTDLPKALAAVQQRGYLLGFENTDAWWVVSDTPNRAPILEIEPDPDEISADDAHTLIDAGIVALRDVISLEGGTAVSVYALTQEQTQRAG